MISVYEPTKSLASFHIAGFGHHEGYSVFSELQVGTKVEMRHEPGNPYDPEAIAIYYGETKIGYVPKEENSEFYTYLYYGYDDLYETFICMVNDDAHPERQFNVVVTLKDARETEARI